MMTTLLNLSDGTPALLSWEGVGPARGQWVVEHQPGDLETYPMFATVLVVLVFVPFPPYWQVVHGRYIRLSCRIVGCCREDLYPRERP